MTYRFGDSVLVDFPFADRNAEKRRPGLVLAQDPHADLLIVRISSKKSKLSTDITLADWKLEGLNVPSAARLLKMTTTNQANVLTLLGRISSSDKKSVVDAMKKFAASLD